MTVSVHRTTLLVAAVLLTTATLFAIEARRRHDLYWYDVGQDYRFTFSRTQSLPVEIAPDGFVFPDTATAWSTALLRVRLDSDWTARWFEPSVTVGAGSSAERQVFERGARGDRYLVLTPEFARPGAKVAMGGSHVRWNDQRGELLLFDDPLPAAGTVLVVAPHPDDAEIAAFGLYASRDSVVATVTPGNYVDGAYAHLDASEAGQDTLRADVRTWDSLVVPSWGGVPSDRTVNLGYLGLTLERLYAERHLSPHERVRPDPNFGRYRRGAVETLLSGRPGEPSWASLVNDFRALLASTRPAVVVAPHPSLDGMPDHQLTTLALLEALGDGAPADVTLLLYTNHHVLSEYYPFGPADAVVTLPPWFDAALPVGSAYAHRLDADQQRDKLFALDAMHDLRAAPRRLTGGPVDRFLLRLRLAVTGLVRDPVSDYSYYRRAVRPNELFFVYGPADRASLLAYAARRAADR
jgi:LmbE family N-acetylglucosaminyl deacetylase